MEKNVYIKIIEFCLRHPDGFTEAEIIDNKNLPLKDWEKNIIVLYLKNAETNFYQTQTLSHTSNIETPFLVIRDKDEAKGTSCEYIVNFDANFKYLDYQELKFGQESSKSARVLSLVAITISIASIFSAILITLFVKQTIRIDTTQIEQIENNISETQK